MLELRRCRYCDELILQAVEGAGWASVECDEKRESIIRCRVHGWHTPYDIPQNLDPDTVETWLAEPELID